jgi:hypothetical protein
LRSDALEAPDAKELLPLMSDSEPTDDDGSNSNSSRTDPAPLRRISSRLMICTGDEVSTSMRLMFDPVISTRCVGAVCADASGAEAISANAQAMWIWDRGYTERAPLDVGKEGSVRIPPPRMPTSRAL